MIKHLCGVILLCCVTLAGDARSQVRTISYYDITKPAISIENPGVQGDYAYTGFGERFTLAGASGYLDSIRIHFDSVSGDLLQVGVFRDIVSQTSRGTFHLADYTFTGLLARTEIDLSELDSLHDFWVTIPMDHLRVPKEFHIGVGANQITNGSDEFTSTFRLMGERHIGQEATLDSRSDILLTQNFAEFTTDIFDGFFTFGGQSLGIDFHIDAVVDESSSVVRASETGSFKLYPNPVASGGELHLGEAVAQVVLYDVLGAETARWASNAGIDRITIPKLAPGVYTIVVIKGATSQAEKLIVR